MKSGKQEGQPKAGRKDVLDHIEEFVETRIERHIRKGLQEIESFLKKEMGGRAARGGNGAGPLSYIEALLKDKAVASVAPSTKFLVERVCRRLDWSATRVLVEYGPAQGVMTREFLARLPRDGRLVAIELNPGFAATLSKLQDPRLTVLQGSVVDVARLLEPLSLPPADAVVSGIPFSLLQPVERHRLLHRTEDLLRPGGRFVAYQITAHLVPLLKYHFGETDVQYELRNLPPNFVFTGVK